MVTTTSAWRISESALWTSNNADSLSSPGERIDRDFASRLRLLFNAHNKFFEEVANYLAARDSV
jgi:hypothetical protein